MKYLMKYRYFYEPNQPAGPVASCVLKAKNQQEAKFFLMEIARNLQYYVEIYGIEGSR